MSRLPEGWKLLPIKKTCQSIIDCVNKTAPIVDFETPYKMIRTTNVREGRVDTENVRYVTEATYTQWVRRGAPIDGDLIFTREAPVGEVGILQNSTGVFLGQRTMMYRADPKKSNNTFLFYSLQSQYCRKQIDDLSNGGTVAHMRVPDCGEIKIKLPPLHEQQKIAQILSTWDKAITSTEKLIANSQQQKKALMTQLLTGKKRFANFKDKWKLIKLGNIAKISSGGTPKSSIQEYYNGDIPWVSIADMTKKGKYISSTERNITNLGLQNSTAQIFPPKTILYAMYASIGECSIATVELCSSQAILGIRPQTGFYYEYLYYKLLSYKKIIKLQGQQGTQANLNAGMVKDFQFEYPSYKEQQQIVSILISADKELSSLQNQLQKLKQEKKALMQQLLTGKRRVSFSKTAA